MTFVYIVRCRFTAPEKEAAWNAWYSGPKIDQMLAQPYFRTCQRFRRASGAGRDYLALWTVARAEALTTPEYRSQWGFAQWQEDITDWSRDLFDGRPAPESAFAVPPGGMLRVVSFDGMSAEAAERARAAIADSSVLWLPVAGLDRHTPLIGLKPLSGEAAPPPLGAASQMQDGLYRPIIPLHTRR
jgi:hypothetical protein